MKVWRLFAKILLVVFLAIMLGLVLVSCKATVPVSHHTEKSDSTSTTTDTHTIKKDSANYRQEVLLRMLNRAQTTMALTREQVDSLLTLLNTLPRGTTIIKTDPKLQAQLEILLDSLGVYQFRCVSNERFYTETITIQTRYIHELESKLQEKNTTTSESEKEVREKNQTFWQKAEAFFKTGGIWMIIVIVSLLAFTLLRKRS